MIPRSTTENAYGPPGHVVASASSTPSLEDLRKDVTALVETVRTVAERRARAVQEHADAGLMALRREVRRHPTAAVGLAALGGALLAIALVPRFEAKRTPRSAFAATRADVYDLADEIQSSIRRAVQATGAPLTASLNKVVDAVTSVDAKSSLTPLLERAMSWIERSRSAVAAKVDGGT